MTGSANDVPSSGEHQTNSNEYPTFGPEQRVTHERTVPVYPPSPGKRSASALEDSDGGGDSPVLQQQEYLRPQRTMSIDTVSDENSTETASSATLPGPPAHPLPSIDEQVQRVTEIIHQPLREKQRGYLVSAKWLARVLARSTAGQKSSEYDKSCREGDVGPLDNTDLIFRDWTVSERFDDEEGHPFIPLKPGLAMGTDFEVLPEDAWNLIVSWYGHASKSLTVIRYAHDTAPEGAAQENIQYELYPLIFTIRKLRNDSAGYATQLLKEANYRAVRVLASRSELFQSFLRKIKSAAHVDMKTKVQLWRVIDVLPAADNGKSGMLTPASSPSTSPNRGSTPVHEVPTLLMDVSEFTAMVEGEQREMLDMKDETMNEKYNGHLRLSTIGFADNQTLILEEQTRHGEWVSESVRKAGAKNGILINTPGSSETGTQSKPRPTANISSGRASPASSGPITRGRKRKDGKTRGTVGLTNLGNTCYMNSALQCVRSVEELALYFLQGTYKEDINSDNPLGYGGSIAKTYAAFVHSIYGEDSLSSFAPKLFRNTIGRYQPLFSGYGQQDSQEFLSFLVDALHEDLNRVKKKPYIENPESDDKTVHDPEAIRALGAKFRENFKVRNDSIAMDLFNGFYKNTMICPVCDKVSITFDPFSLVTLQLPIESTWTHDLIISPLYRRPFRLVVDMNKNGTIRTLKEYVAKKVPGLAADKLFIAEIYNHKFYKMFEDGTMLTEASMQPNDAVIVYELDAVPTNFPLPQKSKPNKLNLFSSSTSSDEDSNDTDSPAADRMVVPVFHRYSKPAAFQSRSFTAWPSVILLTREEAKDYDSILKKVLAKVATMTTRPILSEGIESNDNAGSQEDSDTVLMTEEDASSDTGPKINTKSIDGEDGLVDVSMVDVTASTQEILRAGSGLNRQQSLRKPDLLRPDTFIPPMLQNLFEMKYFHSQSEDVPTGWNSAHENTEYPTIASRIRRRTDRRPSAASVGSGRRLTNPEDHSDSEENCPNAATQPSRSDSIIAGPDSDLEDLPAVESLSCSSRRAPQTKPSKLKTYSKKHQSYARSTQSEDDNQPLIRLKEGIILDWDIDAFDALFGGEEGDEMRGQATGDKMEYQEDPELEAKKAKRAARKKSGVSLDDCFTETSRSEILSEENAWYCSRCKELRRASKTLEIWTAPDILVLHLKRFSANRGFRDKVDVLVEFPVEGLDLSGKVGEAEGKQLVYDLFAVDNHYGGLGGGHYTAYAKNFYDGKWYDYNDSLVSQTRPESVVTTAAYLLFYRRRSNHPLGPPYLQKIVEEVHSADSEPISRPTSPAGDGHRLDGSSPNGSSSDSYTVGTNHYSTTDGLSGGLQARGDNQLVRYVPDEDEGIALNDEEMLPDYNAVQGPPAYNGGQSWSFKRLDDQQAGPQHSDDEIPDDARSDRNVAGSDLSDGLNDRLLEDFGEDMAAHTGTPLGISRPPTPDEDEETALQITTPSFEDDDEPVAEVRLDLEKPDDLFDKED